MRRTNVPLLALRGDPHAKPLGVHGKHQKEYGQPLGAKTGSWLTASKETGLQSYNCKELKSADNMNEPGSRFFPSLQ